MPAAPPELGRGVVVGGPEVPEGWERAERITVVAATLSEPGPAIGSLHAAWAARRPVVVQLGVGADALRTPEPPVAPPWALNPAFEFPLERLHFLIWANNFDARSGEPVWWHGRKAARRWDGATEGGPGDVLTGDGTPVLVDGGPLPAPLSCGGLAVVHRWDAEAGRWERPRGGGTPAPLAPDQGAAVIHPSGPARVIAPAGSGKTRVLTERLRHLLGQRGVHPSLVTAVAYNTKAADELRQRCAELGGVGDPHIRTLNSLGLRLCNARHPGGGSYRVLGEPEVRQLVETLFPLRRRANTDVVAPYVEALSAIRLGLVSPAAAEADYPDAQGVADGFERYRAALAERDALDFDEQIYRALEILLTDRAARDSARSSCRLLLVDEFQDLTPAHLLLLRLLSAPGFDCFGVGDDDQVLYGYSGATPEYLLHFDRYFPTARTHALEVNYRCPPAVVEAAAALLSCNAERVDKVIRPSPAAPPDPGGLVECRAPGADLGRIAADTVAGWLAEGVAATEMAVLARVNSALLPVQVALAEAGIPYASLLDLRVLNRTGVRTAFAYLRIGRDPGRIRRADLLETVRRPSRGLAPMVVDMLAKPAANSLADIRRLAGRLSGRDGPKLLAYAEDLEAVAGACAGTAAEALRTIRDAVGLGETMEVLDSSRPTLDRSTHADDLTALLSVAAFHHDVSTFEGWLRGVLERPQPEGPAVLLSTVHRIKGREWDRVLVFGVTQGLLPHRLAGDDEAERRVCHVALTRARTEAVLLADAESPSIFLDELQGLVVPRAPGADRAPRAERGAAAGRRGPAGTGSRSGSPATAGAVPVGGGPSVGGPVGEALRAWRSGVARREAIPAFLVLSDKDLGGIAAAAPRRLADLARCRGIGPNKLERWGDELLAVVVAAADAAADAADAADASR